MSQRQHVSAFPSHSIDAGNGPRKRTSSFSLPRPCKSQRMTTTAAAAAAAAATNTTTTTTTMTTTPPLRRTTSYVVIPEVIDPEPVIAAAAAVADDAGVTSCSPVSLRHHLSPKERKRSISTRRRGFEVSSQITVHIPSSTPTPTPTPTRTVTPPCSQLFHLPRRSSPLVPPVKRIQQPPRATFPRSKSEPNWYKLAITARMRGSVHGRKILSLGPRVALSVLAATMEFEKMMQSEQLPPPPPQPPSVEDIRMDEVTSCAMLSNSWVVVPGEDWEMVDCAAA